MKVFISWSGDISLKVAVTFRDWIPSVIQSVEPYVSSEDIDKGARWSTDIAKELADSTFGILCVTKENLEATWLAFEAGALSKTMDKSFVIPFLFDIKRSEVQGPILQFQSTIFQKEDIRKMIQTLNKACADTGIPEQRLNKTFEVWYPTLEKTLQDLKSESSEKRKEKTTEKTPRSSEILEEILELSRDNQKLLRSPDAELSDNLEEMKKLLEDMSAKIDGLYEHRKMSRRYNAAFLDRITNMNNKGDKYAFLMALSIFKEDFPWIYDMGKDLLDMLKKSENSRDKDRAIREFKAMLEFSFASPVMRDIYGKNIIYLRDLQYSLMSCLEKMAY